MLSVRAFNHCIDQVPPSLRTSAQTSSNTGALPIFSWDTCQGWVHDEDKLQWWSEHFSSVVNCSSVASESILDALPVVVPGPGAGCPAPVDDDAMCAPLSEVEINATAGAPEPR